jgi:ABC-type antimicrobial peptide transport system permease subunit
MQQGSSKNKPPRFAQFLLKRFLREDLAEEVYGDLQENFQKSLDERSMLRARLNYWYQVVNYLRPFAIHKFKPSPSNHYAMYQNYFKIGLRHLVKNKGYSFINVGGLAAGMTVALLLGLWIHDELSFDKHFKNYHRIAQVLQNQTFNGEVETWWSQARQIGPALRENYGSDFEHVIMSSWNGNHKLTFGDKSVSKSGNYMEEGVTEMLSLEMIAGTRGGLHDPHSILLSESTAKALFGDEEPMNKIIRVDDKLDVKVTGVYEDIPFSTSFSNLTFIAPWQLYVTSEDLEKRTGWGNSWFQCIAQVAENASMNDVSLKIKDAKLNGVRQAGDDDDRFKPEILLHPMPRWHLYSSFENGVPAGGSIQYVWLFAVVGTFVLLLACINFINLTTARSEKRSKEVGIRKTIGSIRVQLMTQFFLESWLVVTLAFGVSLLLTQLLSPWFNEITGKQLGILWTNPIFWLSGAGITLLTGLVAGIFPALYLSSFEPVQALKGAYQAGRFSSLPRQVLVVFQFTVSISLITGTVVIFKQIQFAQSRPIGYNYSGLVTAPIKSDEIRDHFDTFRNELKKTGAVDEVALTDTPITATYVTNSGFSWKDKDPAMSEEFVTLRVTHDFGKMADWEIVQGRDFSTEYPSDSMAFVINESAAKYMNLENPVGESVTWGNNGDYKIIGVVKDLVTQSPYAPVKQMFFFLHYQRVYFVNIRIAPNESARNAIAKIETVFAKYDPANPFEYNFADQEFSRKFSNEKRIGNLSLVFASLAIFISCLGLFGLASFMAERRTKEIGIRKVLGASVIKLWKLLSFDFVVLIGLSCFIALPLAYFYMDSWLQNYEYRTDIPWWIFSLTATGAVLITLLTVSYHAVKAALLNPVVSLRSE